MMAQQILAATGIVFLCGVVFTQSFYILYKPVKREVDVSGYATCTQDHVLMTDLHRWSQYPSAPSLLPVDYIADAFLGKNVLVHGDGFVYTARMRTKNNTEFTVDSVVGSLPTVTESCYATIDAAPDAYRAEANLYMASFVATCGPPVFANEDCKQQFENNWPHSCNIPGCSFYPPPPPPPPPPVPFSPETYAYSYAYDY